MKVSALITFLFSTVFFIPISSNAGMFGASNYEECVFDKMKGQPAHLIGLARDACRQAFPLPPQEVFIDSDKLKWDWCESSATNQSICVSNIPKNIKLTRIEAMFFSDTCGVKQEKPGIKGEAEKSMFSDKFTMKLPYGTYKCTSVWFYGYEK